MREKLEMLISQGCTTRQIAKALAMSQTNVRWHMRKYGLRTEYARRLATQRGDGSLVERECRQHGMTVFVLEGRGVYRCRRCRVEAVRTQRLKVKAELVAQAGGQCIQCGYNRDYRSLSFHHRNRMTKEYSVGELIQRRDLKTALYEIQKCDLLCLNCHGETENKLEDGWRNGNALV